MKETKPKIRSRTKDLQDENRWKYGVNKCKRSADTRRTSWRRCEANILTVSGLQSTETRLDETVCCSQNTHTRRIAAFPTKTARSEKFPKLSKSSTAIMSAKYFVNTLSR